nr:immunoglobulin light chain junction region [Macaca mulatta]
CMIWHKNVYIF